MNFYNKILLGNNKNANSIKKFNGKLDEVNHVKTPTGSTGTTEQLRRKSLNCKNDYLVQRYVTCFDNQPVLVNIEQIYGRYE